MDLSQISTEDLQALKSGDLTKVSTAGLQALRGQSAAPAPASAAAPATFGHTLAGEADLAGTGISALARGIPNAAQDLYRQATGQPQLPPGQGVAGQAHLGQAGTDLANTVSGMLPAPDPRAAAAMADPNGPMAPPNAAAAGVNRTLNDVAAIAPVAGPLRAAADATGLTEAASRAAGIAAPAAAVSNADAAAQALGLRKVTTVGKTLAGSSAGPTLQATNQAAGDTAIASQAGMPKGQIPSFPNLVDARTAPAKTMTDFAESVPDGPLDANAQIKLQKVGVPEGGTRGPDQATQAAINGEIRDALQANTGPEHLANVRSLRQEGFEGLDADTAAERNLARAKLSIADAVEGHLIDNAPPDGPVSPQQFLDARKALAKNYTATSVLKGNNFDLQKLGRIQRGAPQLLDGDMDTVANFAQNNPEITGHPSALRAPNIAGDLSNVSLAHPASWLQPLTGAAGRALLRRGTPLDPNSLGAQFTPP